MSNEQPPVSGRIQPGDSEEASRLWRPPSVSGVSMFRARFRRFAFSRHVHAEFGIGVIEKGTQKFFHRGRMHYAPAPSIITVNPDEIHDGAAASPGGYQYRMTYIETGFVEALIRDITGAAAALSYFPEPVTEDPEISCRLLYALRLFDRGPDVSLEAETVFIQAVGDLFVRHAYPRRKMLPGQSAPDSVSKAREMIHARLSENLSLDEMAREAGVSRFHFLRLFKNATELTPHAYITLRRLERARSLIQGGASLTDAALEAGFSDQSHLNRRFKAAYGITPGQFQRVFG